MSASAAARSVVRQTTVDDILDALRRAPSRPITDEERSLLTELEGRPVAWLSHEELMSAVVPRDDER